MLSIIEIGDNVIEVLATNGDNHLGGDDFDQRIVEHILSQIKQNYRVELKNDYAALQRIKEAAEQAKKELSSSSQTTINLPYLTQNVYFVGFNVHNDNCSIQIIDCLEQITGGYIALFCSCGYVPTDEYKLFIENKLKVWLPDDAR